MRWKKIKNKFGEFVILKRYYKEWNSQKDSHKYKTYLCKCLNDNYEFELKDSHISQGIGCPKCSKRKPILGFNTLYDLRKDLLEYIVDIEDSKKYTANSGKKILCRCPVCGSQKYVIINNLSKFGFSCSYCSDGISYPNKFLRAFLNQLNIYYIAEKRFDWSDNKVYDFFLPNYNCIIEVNGLQHYEKTSFGTRTLKEEQENDKYKLQMANKHHIKYYVTLDCRESNPIFIKESILSSFLPKLLLFDDLMID